MIGFAEGFLDWIASTLVPAFVGLVVIIGLNRFVKAKYLAAFAFGIFLWFFVDTIGGAATLDVNSGFGGGIPQVAVVILFVVGLLLVFAIDRNRSIVSLDFAIGKFGIAIPALVAVAVGIHGMGEGADYGYSIYVCGAGSALNCFGGLSTGVAYVLHKVLEPMMIGACYAVYSGSSGPATSFRWVKHTLIFSILFVIPSLVGTTIGYFIMGPSTGYLAGLNTTYFYALGTGTSIYAAIRLVGPLFKMNGAAPPREAMIVALAIILGMITVYFAALFHSV